MEVTKRRRREIKIVDRWNFTQPSSRSQALDLASISSLAAFFQGKMISPAVQEIVRSIMDLHSTRAAAKANFNERATNSACILGSCYALLAGVEGGSNEIAAEELQNWMKATIGNFGWSDHALGNLVKFLKTR